MPLYGVLFLLLGVIYFSPTELYLREIDVKDAKVYLFYRDTPFPEDGALLVKIAPKDSYHYSVIHVLQSGYNWHGDLELEIERSGENTLIITESRRPTKWEVVGSGELKKIE